MIAAVRAWRKPRGVGVTRSRPWRTRIRVGRYRFRPKGDGPERFAGDLVARSNGEQLFFDYRNLTSLTTRRGSR